MYEMKREDICAEVVINPLCHTTVRRIQSFLLADSHYRFLLYAGLLFHETGSWILQDGPLSFSTFSRVFQSSSCNGSGPIDLAVSVLGDWKRKSLSDLVDGSRIRIPSKTPDAAQNPVDDLERFAERVSVCLEPRSVVAHLPATEVVGNVSFHKPTMYIFPSGEGSSSLFCISGYNMLVDGGFGRQCCFWSLVRHFEAVDALLVTSLAEENVLGIAAFLERKVHEDLHPRIGAVFINTQCCACPAKTSEGGDELIVSLAEERASVVERLQKLNVQLYPCLVSSQGSQPVNLYNRVGYGSLDMYVLSPAADSKERKDYSDLKSSVAPSVCTVVVFRPAAPEQRPTRILYCGSSSQAKIFAGFDRLRTLSLFQTVSGLPPDEPTLRRSSLSSVDKSLLNPPRKPRTPSVGSASARGRAPDVKRPKDVHATSRTTSSSASASSVTKAISKEPQKTIRPADAAIKPVTKLCHDDRGVKPQSSTMKDASKPVSARQVKEVRPGKDAGKSSRGVKGSAPAASHRAVNIKPSASRVEPATGTKLLMSAKSKVHVSASESRPKVAAKHSSQPHTGALKTSTERLDAVDDKTAVPSDEKVEDNIGSASVAAETNIDERHDESDARSDEQTGEVFDTAAEVIADHLTVADVDVVTQHKLFDCVTAAVEIEPDAASCDVFTSKPEAEHDVDEKDIDTTEVQHDAGEVTTEQRMVSISPSEHTSEDEVNAHEVLSSATDLPVVRVEQSSGGMINGAKMDQFSADGKDAVAGATSHQSDNSQSSHDDMSLGLGQHSDVVVEPLSTEISDLMTDAQCEPCATDGEAADTETCEQTSGTEPSSLMVVAGDVENKTEEHQSSSEVAELDTAVDSSTRQFCETEEKLVDEDKNKIDDQMTMNNNTGDSHAAGHDSNMIDTEMPAPCVEAGELEVLQDNGKPAEEQNSEVVQDNTTNQESHEVETNVIEDGTEVPQDNSKPSGEVSKVLQGDASELDGNIVCSVDVGDTREPLQDNVHEDGTQFGKGDSDLLPGAAVSNSMLVTEQHASTTAEGKSDMSGDNADSDGKPSGEVCQDNAVGKGCNVVVKEECASAVVQDHSKLADDNGGGLPDEGSPEFDPQRDWEAPQQLPAPVNEKNQTSADGTKPRAAAAAERPTGVFKVPAAMAKKTTTRRHDLNATAVVGTSRTAEVGTRSRLSLQPGELKLLSLVGQRKTPTASLKPSAHFYVDLVSLPVSATGTCIVDTNFFRRIRARYYIVNSSEPDPRVLEFLAEAKATWGNPVEPVTVIPTGNPESLLEWYSSHYQQMTALLISISPSVSQCAVELQGSSCAAYRLQF